MDAPLLLALARAKHRRGCPAVENVLAGPRFLALAWVPKREEAFPRHGWHWVFLLSPQPELWLLHDKDEVFAALKSLAKGDQSRRWSLELKGARLESVEGDPRERWLGLRFQRRALTGRMEQTRLAFQAIPGRGGLRLDGTDPLTLVRLGLGQPFPAEPPLPASGSPALERWRERWGEALEQAVEGLEPAVLPGEGDLLARHHAWSLVRATKLFLDPRRAAQERRLREERKRLDRYGAALEEDRARHALALERRAAASALAAELYRLKDATGEAALLDGSRIPLPPGLRAGDAVQKWFAAVKKAERGLERVARLERDRQRQLRALEDQEALLAQGGLDLPGGDRKHSIGNKEGKKAMPREKDPEQQGAGKRADGKGRAYRTEEVEGFEILIGKGDADNDNLTFKVGNPLDFWLHVAGVPGSHVIIRNPARLDEPPRAVLERAAQLAAWYSKARDGGKVEVHWCRVADVSKPRGFEAGKVQLRSWKGVRVYPKA